MPLGEMYNLIKTLLMVVINVVLVLLLFRIIALVNAIIRYFDSRTSASSITRSDPLQQGGK